MDIRFSLARLVARVVGWSIRLLFAGGGTSLPGKIGLLIDPLLLRKLASRFPMGTVIITGTNGKTTTARMLAGILKGSGLEVVHNRAGANLRSGLATTLVNSQGDIGLLEVDEATVPVVAGDLAPKVIVVTNIFRDQLDRYGELDRTAALIRTGIEKSGSETTAVLNADDPRVAHLAEGSAAKVLTFGLEDEFVGGESGRRDSRDCQVCGTALDYELYFYSHLGHYACASCGAKRPVPEISAADIRWTSGLTNCRLNIEGGERSLTLPVTGLYNLYNALAAAGAASALGLGLDSVIPGLEDYRPAFGRMEHVIVEGKRLVLMLVKNPTGFDQVIEAILTDGNIGSWLVAINDNQADGTDVSWLWDVNLEKVAHLPAVVSGIRAADMGVRLKYAGSNPESLAVERDLGKAIGLALAGIGAGRSLAVVCTYTALFEARRALADAGAVKEFWKDEI